jgi:hypothetical protein
VIECAPTASDAVLSVAEPPETGAVPSDDAPSKNWTVPVALAGVIVAVTVTLWPTTDGFGDVVTAVVLEPVATVWPCTADVLPVKLALPE